MKLIEKFNNTIFNAIDSGEMHSHVVALLIVSAFFFLMGGMFGLMALIKMSF